MKDWAKYVTTCTHCKKELDIPSATTTWYRRRPYCSSCKAVLLPKWEMESQDACGLAFGEQEEIDIAEL